MAKPIRILFLSVPIGSGHTRAAQAVSKSLLEHSDVTAEIKLLDIFDYLDKKLLRIIVSIYLKIIEVFPWIYGRMYNWGNKHRCALSGRNILNNYLAAKMLNYIRQYQPSLIVCTHATAAGIAAQLIKNQQISVPIVAVVTDFTLHRLWVYPEISLYYVADKKMLCQHSIICGKINCFGIPISREFNNKYNKIQLRRKLGFSDELLTILIMGGGSGALPINRIIAICDQLACRLQIIAVAGNNVKMYNKLKLQEKYLQNPAFIYGFSDNIHELMAAADLLISKSGGLTSAEALCMGLPMVIFRAIPGQETANAKYLIDNNAAWQAKSYYELKAVLEKLLINEKQLLSVCSKHVLSLAKPNASDDIAESLLGF